MLFKKKIQAKEQPTSSTWWELGQNGTLEFSTKPEERNNKCFFFFQFLQEDIILQKILHMTSSKKERKTYPFCFLLVEQHDSQSDYWEEQFPPEYNSL